MNSLQEWSGPSEYWILFKESRPPEPESLAPLGEFSFDRGGDGSWTGELGSVNGCRILIRCEADPAGDISTMTRFSPGLSDEEKEKIGGSRSRWIVMIDPGRGPILETRKRAMLALGKILRTIRRGVGVYMADSLRVWSLGMLSDELMTKATLDIESLYCIHAVGNTDGTSWVHTHGLAAIGGFDIDLINPSQDMLGGVAYTLIRALAFAILEGDIAIDTPSFEIAHPGGRIRMVPAEEFDRSVDPRYAHVREADENHIHGRAVLCEPRLKKGVLGLGKSRPEPSRFVRGSVNDNTVFALSKTATDIAAQRSQETFPLLVDLMQEFDSLELPVLAKVACPVDAGDGDEHIWFEVHSADDNGIDGTCINQPYDVSGLREGDRGRYGAGQISEWQMQTPLGSIKPNQLAPIRHIKANRDQLEEAMRQYRAENAG